MSLFHIFDEDGLQDISDQTWDTRGLGGGRLEDSKGIIQRGKDRFATYLLVTVIHVDPLISVKCPFFARAFVNSTVLCGWVFTQLTWLQPCELFTSEMRTAPGNI